MAYLTNLQTLSTNFKANRSFKNLRVPQLEPAAKYLKRKESKRNGKP